MSDAVLTLEMTGDDPVPAFVSRLRPARFTSPGGVESVFLYDSLSRSRAKKGSAHDVLDADTTILQDMGSSLQVFNFAAYFVGADCDKSADAFYASLYEHYTPDKPGVLNHPRWGDINVMPFGEPEQSEEYISGAGISHVAITFRETRSQNKAKSTALSIGENVSNAATMSQSALERAQKGIATTKAAYAKFKAQIRKKIKSVTDVIDTIGDLSENVSTEVTAITQDIYSALDEAALPVTILSMVGNLFTTLAAVPSTAGAMAVSFFDMASDILTGYGQDIDSAVTSDDKIAIASSLQYMGSATIAASAVAALNATYQTRDEVGAIVDALVDAYAFYLVSLDAAASSSAEFVPDHDTGSLLRGIVLDAQALLIDRAFSLKVARSYTLTAPSDALTETWTHYGDLSYLSFFCQTNGIGGGEFIELPPGRKLVYYA